MTGHSRHEDSSRGLGDALVSLVETMLIKSIYDYRVAANTAWFASALATDLATQGLVATQSTSAATATPPPSFSASAAKLADAAQAKADQLSDESIKASFEANAAAALAERVNTADAAQAAAAAQAKANKLQLDADQAALDAAAAKAAAAKAKATADQAKATADQAKAPAAPAETAAAPADPTDPALKHFVKIADEISEGSSSIINLIDNILRVIIGEKNPKNIGGDTTTPPSAVPTND
jgi:uncharacterized membrane protein YqiK